MYPKHTMSPSAVHLCKCRSVFTTLMFQSDQSSQCHHIQCPYNSTGVVCLNRLPEIKGHKLTSELSVQLFIWQFSWFSIGNTKRIGSKSHMVAMLVLYLLCIILFFTYQKECNSPTIYKGLLDIHKKLLMMQPGQCKHYNRMLWV